MPSKRRRGARSRGPLSEARKKQAAETRTRALHAASLARRGLSLTKAARRAKTTIATVKRYAGTTIEKTTTGRYSAKRFDRMKRPMKVPTEWGTIVLDVRDSRKASELARYWNEVHNYLRTGIDTRLRRFSGKGITVVGEFYEYLTDLRELDRQARAGEIQFTDIYEPTV